MGLTLRQARPADRLRCAHIFVSAQALAYPRQPAQIVGPEDFEPATREEDLWVAEGGGRILGLVSIYHPARFVHHLYVDPRHLRQGVGRALLALALERCGGSAELKCDEANRVAQNFYLAAGWHPAGWGWAPRGPWIAFRRRATSLSP